MAADGSRQGWLRYFLGARHLHVHAFILVAAVLVCSYALSVISYVLTLPSIGVRTAFTPVVNGFDEDHRLPESEEGLRPGDRIVKIGDYEIADWPQLLRAFVTLRQRATPHEVESKDELEKSSESRLALDGEEYIRVSFRRPEDSAQIQTVWCRLGHAPLESITPIVLWVFIKAGLFLVGALVYWQRPREGYARLFFWLCVVSCGAYVGGYQWQTIASQPFLLLVFMVCAFMLPPVSLHFYLVFPRPKPFCQQRPWTTLAVLYGPACLFLALLLQDYVRLRLLMANGLRSGGAEYMRVLLDEMLLWIYIYLAIAFIWYILSLVCLVHSFRNSRTPVERNQVKWILFGALAALAPLGYSLYLALVEKARFSGGAATWPMFAASLSVTLAFTVSITRYRLMELDKLVNSGVVYFAISALAALFYYGLVILGVLLLGSRIVAEPSLTQALGVAGTVLLLLLFLDLIRGRIKKALDHHFRREKVMLDRTLQRMSQAVAQMVDPPTLARRLLQSTTELLGIERGAVYLRQAEPPLFRLAETIGPPPPLADLSTGSPLVEELRVQGRLMLRELRHAGNGSDPGPALRQLSHLGGEVAFVLAHEGPPLALLILGPRSQDAYSQEDLNLLSSFCQVTSLALVGSEGGRTIEALNRELKAKVDKIAEQQRRILALQNQLIRRDETTKKKDPSENGVTAEPPMAPAPPAPPAGIIGSSPAVLNMLHLVHKVAGSTSSVLIRGESGTGKELLARAIHESSPRAARPFIKVHCAALSPTLLESELFGHVKGAFTGAVKDRPGRFELAHGGTLFLDEIGDVSWEVQTKLLRVLQEMMFERVGSSEPVQVDVRILAATHQDLERLIHQGRFREDLFYRLNVLPLHVPPLRQRREDIAELTQHFLNIYAQEAGKGNLLIDDDALSVLKAAPWPGNIRQLENVLERAVIITEGPIVTVEDLPPDLLQPAFSAEPLHPEHIKREQYDQKARDELTRALADAEGNKAAAARALGLARGTFLSRLKKYGLS